MLDLRDKTAIASGLLRFLHGPPADDRESFASWLQRTGQTDRAIRHFWEPVVIGALNDSFERCSVKYAGKVFDESFLRSPEAGRLGVPARPLSEFADPIADLARRLGVDVRLGASVDAICRGTGGRWRVQLGAEEVEAGAVILAGDLRGAQKLLSGLPHVPDQPLAVTDLDNCVVAPITTIHLWYDREVVDLDHAVLLDTRIQWVFAKSRIRRWDRERGSYLELVISASWDELKMGREEILASALREFALFFPKAREAQLVKSSVLKRGAGDILGRAGNGCASSSTENRVARPVPRGRLDRDRMALHDGGRSAQREARRWRGVVGERLRVHGGKKLPATGLMKLFE